MEIFNMTRELIPAVAELMSTIKPEHPAGWIFCRELVGLRAIELECSGFNERRLITLPMPSVISNVTESITGGCWIMDSG